MVTKVREILSNNVGINETDLIVQVKEFIYKVVYGLVARVQNEDLNRNEIIMYDDVTGREVELLMEGVFPELSKFIGHEGSCWYFRDGTLDSGALMCTVPSIVLDAKIGELEYRSSDIFIKRSKFQSYSLDRPVAFARFNTCDNGAKPSANSYHQSFLAYQSFIHEVGHALGLGDGASKPPSWRAPWFGDPAHPDFEDSVLVAANFYRCSPYPIDIMAVTALYQSQYRSP